MGLLLPHKRKITVYPDMMSVSIPGVGGQVGGGKRGKVQHFSADSRYRLFRLLHQLKFERVTFVTLTYPAEFPTNPRKYKAHLKEYRRRFEARYGKVPAVWRLEFQERGAPHYHLMYLDAPFVPVPDWCALWSDVIHTKDENHRKIGVDVKLITQGKEAGLVASYLGKYVAKVDERCNVDSERSPGRWWGKWNVQEEVPIEIEVMDWQAAHVVVDALSRRGSDSSWQPTDPTVCTVFGNHMGRDDFQHVVIRCVGEVTRSRAKRRARIFDGSGVN